MEHKEQKEDDKLAKEKEKRNLLEYWENKLKEGQLRTAEVIKRVQQKKTERVLSAQRLKENYSR